MSGMKAIILKEDDTFYETIVFAFEYEYMNGYVTRSYCYIVNENNEIIRISGELVKKGGWFINQVLIRNSRPSNDLPWKKTKEIEGYDFFIDDKKELEAIKSKQPVSKNFLDYCLKLNKEGLNFYKNYNNNIIKDVNDIEDLNRFVGWFHDGHIAKVIWNKDKTKLTLELTGVWSFEKFWLDFEGNIFTSFNEDEFYEPRFSEASIFFDKDKQICFAVADDAKTKEELKNSTITRVFADKLSFRYELQSVKKFLKGN